MSTLAPTVTPEDAESYAQLKTIITSIAACNTGVVFILGLLHQISVVRNVGNYNVRDNLTIVAFLFPVTCAASLLGLYLPKSGEFTFVVGLTFIVMNLFTLVALMNSLFGSRVLFSRHMMATHQRISFAAEPCCCWVKCCPKFLPTEANLRVLGFTVMQSLVVRVCVAIASIVMILNGVNQKDKVFMIINLCAVVSMITSVVGANSMFNLIKEIVRPLRFIVIQRLVVLTQFLYTFQKFALSIAVAAKGFEDGDPRMTPVEKANFWYHFVITCEMLLFSILATILLRPSKSTLLSAKYPLQLTPPGSDVDANEQRQLASPIDEHRMHIELRG